MAEVILFIIFLILSLSLLAALLINLFRLVRTQDKAKGVRRLKSNGLLLLMACAACILFVWITQLTAGTPAIENENKEINSISELRQVTLNGRKEWISIRGQDKNNPVLLFLAGGPGGSQMAAVRHDLSELEEHFVVVNWDQPGSGKSYHAMPIKDITVNTYIDDGYALTKYLCNTFNQDKIHLVGESWGSALGIFLADRAPEFYHSFIGTGQMIDFKQTEIADYQKALELAQKSGDKEKISNLKKNGIPPYYGEDVTWKSAEYLQYLSGHMAKNPEIENNHYNTMRDLFSEEYGIMDKINYLRGIAVTFGHVYQQLYEIDLRKDYTQLEVPVYFFLGRHDLNAPAAFAEEYYEKLNAPKKEIIWFEHSGHSPWLNENGRFAEEVIKISR